MTNAHRTSSRPRPSDGRAEGQFSVGKSLLDEPGRQYLSSLIERMKSADDLMYIYILASSIGVLYVGVTNCLNLRTFQHRTKLNAGFTNTKNCTRLVYFEIHYSPGEAIDREKQIKRWRREKKERLIKTLNSPWIDLTPFLPALNEGRGD